MTFQGCIRSKNHKNLKRLSVEMIEESEGVIEVRMRFFLQIKFDKWQIKNWCRDKIKTYVVTREKV
jgi:hypothetical protein